MEKELSRATVEELEGDTEKEYLRKIEAALFIAARFVSVQELVLLTDINPLQLKELLVRLAERYGREDSGLEIIHKGDLWKMDVKQEYVGMINTLATGSSEFTRAEQETLAVIAYKQPVKQSVVINIRGNKAYDHIKLFITNGLVVAKRLGHTKELRLSDTFYEYFHVQEQALFQKGAALESADREIEEEPVDNPASEALD